MSINHYPGAGGLEDQVADHDKRIARLERQLEAETRERSALEKIVIPDQVVVRGDLKTLGEDLELAKAAIDARLAELAASDPATAEGVAKGIMEALMPVFTRQLSLIEQQSGLIAMLFDRQTAADAEIDQLKALLAPALRGEAKLVAQEV